MDCDNDSNSKMFDVFPGEIVKVSNRKNIL